MREGARHYFATALDSADSGPSPTALIAVSR